MSQQQVQQPASLLQQRLRRPASQQLCCMCISVSVSLGLSCARPVVCPLCSCVFEADTRASAAGAAAGVVFGVQLLLLSASSKCSLQLASDKHVGGLFVCERLLGGVSQECHVSHHIAALSLSCII